MTRMHFSTLSLLLLVTSTTAFAPLRSPASSSMSPSLTTIPREQPLTVAQGFSEDYGWGMDVVRRKEREARAAEAGDRIVEVSKPLGVVLEEDKNGDVFIAEVAPGSNGARAGLQVGEKISMVSATFGSEMWSARGAGLGRVMKAIKVRVGTTVSLVVQNEKEAKRRAKETKLSAEERREKFLDEQRRRDSLLDEINSERKDALKTGFGLNKKFFGLWGNEDN